MKQGTFAKYFLTMEQNKPKKEKQTNKQTNFTIYFYKFLYAPRIKTP